MSKFLKVHIVLAKNLDLILKLLTTKLLWTLFRKKQILSENKFVVVKWLKKYEKVPNKFKPVKVNQNIKLRKKLRL